MIKLTVAGSASMLSELRNEMKHPVHALIIKPDNNVTKAVMSTLVDYQDALNGGYLEAVSLRGGTMYVDEEYALRPMLFEDYNLIATALVRTVGYGTLMSGGGIYGPAVVVGPTDQEGWDTDVPVSLMELAYEIQGEVAP